MKKRLAKTLGWGVLLGAISMPMAYAADVLCEEKARDVREQLASAQESANSQRAEGLQRALEAIEGNCTNQSILEDAAEDVRDSQRDVQEQQAELEEALSEGDDDDIQDKRADLEQATRELNADTDALIRLHDRLVE